MRFPYRYVVLDKKRGETPLEALMAWKSQHPEYEKMPATYAGRLDPMAEGKLLILLGEECKKKDAYTGLDKEYIIEVVFDLSTDTGDALGIPAYEKTTTVVDAKKLQLALPSISGTYSVPYPKYSSKTVDGTPLFQRSLEGTLPDALPMHDETIYIVRTIKIEQVPSGTLKERILDSLALVPVSDEPSKALGADFRQEVIRAGWRALFSSIPDREFTVIRLRVSCGTGTYMRTLAERLAHELGTTGFALSIRRTKIGRYWQFGPFGFWTKKY